MTTFSFYPIEDDVEILVKKILPAILAIGCSLLAYFFVPELDDTSRKVLSVFIFAIFFWALEIIPLYATSLVIVVLLTFLLTNLDDPKSMPLFFTQFANPVIMLFLGGLVMAAAANKHGVDQFLMEKLLVKLGNRSSTLLTGFLCCSAFFSMWMSNTAAVAMMLTLSKPILDVLRPNDPLKKGMVIAIAFGANIGGIGTPIGTPPNAIAIGILREYGLNIDFLSWIIMALPLVILLLIIAVAIILFLFPPQEKTVSGIIPQKIRLTRQGLYVMLIAAAMILLWLTQPLHHIPESLIALSGVSAFALTQLISVHELRTIPWDILVLMWGGLALGEAIQMSNLVDTIATFQGLNILTLTLIFSLTAFLLTSFISNTATANLLLPIAVSLDPLHQSFLPISTALACSFSFTFPISTPPNAMAYATGLITIKDMFKAGFLIGLIGLVLMLIGFDTIIPWVL